MPDTANVKDCLQLPPQIFLIFTLRNVTWLVSQYKIVFYLTFCLYRACFTHLISSNLSCNPCLRYYDQLVHFDKEINANVYRHSLWECYKRFYCSFEWHLTPPMTLYIKTCIRWHPVLSGDYSIPRGSPLETGFTVLFQKLSCKRPLLEFLKWPWPLFRPEIWHFLLFSVSR